MAVLYLVADLASRSETGLAAPGYVVAAVAVVCALAPFTIRADLAIAGRRRVSALAAATGIALTAAVAPGRMSPLVDTFAALAAVVAGALVVDLAWSVPDAPRNWGRRTHRLALVAAAAVTGVLAIVAMLPPWYLGGQLVLLPARLRAGPALFALAALVVALALRLLRRRLGSSPGVLAANAWALMGLVPAAIAGLGAWLLAPLPPGEAGWSWALGGFAAFATVAGHVGLVDLRRRREAGTAAPRIVAALVSVFAVGVAGALGSERLPRSPVVVGLVAGLLPLAGLALYRALLPGLRLALAPYRGRLIEAAEHAIRAAGTAASLEDAARAVLPRLRQASREGSAVPRLYSIDPAREVCIDASGEPLVRDRALPDALAEWLSARPGEIIVRPALEQHVVRRPELRRVVEVLVSLDALCVVPLSVRGELEGALVVPRGDRQTAPTLDELGLLERLGDQLAAVVSLLSSQVRAQRRAASQERGRLRAEERIEGLEEELEKLRADARVLRAGRSASRVEAPQIAYSSAMRAFEARLEDTAPLGAPVLMLAEGGSPVDQIARRMHERSGREDGPFVVVDAASVRPEDAAKALVGEGGGPSHPGWLRLASGGTLVLADVPALGVEGQRVLAESLATREARPVGGHTVYPIDVRVVATSRVPLSSLAAAGAFDEELAERLGKLSLTVPPLRERREDIPSLVLLGLDRACRIFGRNPVGIAPGALDRLVAYDWPGNLRELQHVLDRAMAACAGQQIGEEQLPSLGVAEVAAPAGDALDQSYAELERAALVRALDRAGGNKSEAARLLELKRTTFLDKLKRHGLASSSKSPERAAE
jgi:two-component system response regulator HydG